MARDHEWQEILDAAQRQVKEQRLARMREERLQKEWDRYRCARMRAALAAKHQALPVGQQVAR